MKKRYERNLTTISAEECERLAGKTVCVAGCGGLGGGVIENLIRIGVGTIIAVDGDTFDETNLNRQVLSNEGNIGKSKAEEAALQMQVINSDVSVTPMNVFIDADNAEDIIGNADVVVDALDNISTRKILEDACEKQGLPLVHGAIAGWNGQVAVIMPGDRIVRDLYEGEEDKGEEVQTGNPSFTPAVISAIQAAETVKVLLGREGTLKGKLLTVDLLNHQFEVIDFGE